MKFKIPPFLESVNSPIVGETLLRNNAAKLLCTPKPTIVVGIDEVGRGPLAGPVVACAAVLKSPDILPSLNDSKKLSRKKREEMFEAVQEACCCFAIASASVEEIDDINILQADFLAMRRALQALGLKNLNETAPQIPIFQKGTFKDFSSNEDLQILIAVDGNLKISGINPAIQLPIIKGDGKIASISAASILAKVFRDRYMDNLENIYPGYGFNKHAGYGTKTHLEAIRHLGLTPEHRKSFHPKSLQTEIVF